VLAFEAGETFQMVDVLLCSHHHVTRSDRLFTVRTVCGRAEQPIAKQRNASLYYGQFTPTTPTWLNSTQQLRLVSVVNWPLYSLCIRDE